MDIHEKINIRSYYTTFLVAGRLKIPYGYNRSVYDRPRFYFNSDKKMTFNFKK